MNGSEPARLSRTRGIGLFVSAAVLVAAAVVGVRLLAADDHDATLVSSAGDDGDGAATPATATTVPADQCRNSHDPGCGPFRFDPSPGPDSPMTVEIAAIPASPRAGEAFTFHVVLHDPDGVSYGGTTFAYDGGGAIGSTRTAACEKYGAWDPPAPDPSRATEVQDIGHVYAEPGTYTATFSFESGPHDCVDPVTGRGDRPYGSSAVGSITVVVQP